MVNINQSIHNMDAANEVPACEYCEIMFIASDSVFAPVCGHLLHETCMDRIFKSNGQRCSTCRVTHYTSQPLRVYLPFQEETSSQETLVSEFKMLKHELKTTEEILSQAKTVSDDAHVAVWIERSNAMTNHKNRKQAELKTLTKEKENLQKKIKELEKLHALQTVLGGTSNEVDKFVDSSKRKHPVDTLATMAAVLKSETITVKAEKTDLRLKMREDRKENEALTDTYRSSRAKFEIGIARNIKRGSQN